MQFFTTQFILSREYLSECFDQTLLHGKKTKLRWVFPAVLITIGGSLLAFSEQPKSLSGLVLFLGIIEVLHIRYQRAWWLTRQLWGKGKGYEIKLTIDENGIKTENPKTTTAFMWKNVDRVIETELGVILVIEDGTTQYLSKSLFPAQIVDEILALNN